MNRYLLDTDSLSLVQRGHVAISNSLAMHADGEVLLSTISIWEQLIGWQNMALHARTHAQQAKTHESLATKLLPSWSKFPVLPLTEPAIVRFEHLKSKRLNVGSNDLRIAAIALENSLIVVTRNLRDFRRVPGLVSEDWSV